MKVSIVLKGFTMDPIMRHWIQAKVHSGLGRVSGGIQRVIVELSEVCGTGGKVKRCTVALTMPDLPVVIVTQAKIGLLASVAYAIDQAADRAARAMRRKQEETRMRFPAGSMGAWGNPGKTRSLAGSGKSGRREYSWRS